jgi:GNAT superfamily N-acetyltransferase
MSGYDVRELLPTDESAVLALLESSLAGGPTGRRSPDVFRWKHRDNPFGSSPGWVAVSGDRLVGVRLLLRWEFRLDDQVVRAVRMVDTATAPDWQGKGVFKRLTLTALESTPDVDLVFNTPNDQSLPGYLRMGWTEVGRVPLHVRPVRPLRLGTAVFRGRVGQRSVTTVPPPVRSDLPVASDLLRARGAEVERLLDLDRPRDGLVTGGSLAYLQWRYGPGSGLDYRAIPVERDGRLAGLGLGRVRYRGPLRELTLGEVLGDDDAVREVLRRSAHGSDVDHVVTVLADPTSRLALRSGFLRAPRAGLLLTTGPRTAVGVDVSSPSAWRLTLGDLELF